MVSPCDIQTVETEYMSSKSSSCAEVVNSARPYSRESIVVTLAPSD